MPRFLANRFVEICGLATSLLTAAIVLALEHWLNFSFFTLTFWIVVPVGAFLTGIAAASGYYIGAIIVNRRPTKALLLNMVIIAAGTFFLIYYVQYRTLEIDGKAVSDYVSFGRFLQVVLTKAEYGLVRHSDAKFEVGAFGYVIGAIQFAAFAFGGLAMYLGLAAKPFCERCGRYFKKAAKHLKTFANQEDFQPFSQRLYSFSPPSAEYLHILKEPHEAPMPQPGAIAVQWLLLSCTSCGDQILEELPKVLNKKNEWSEVAKLKRTFAVSSAMPLLPEIDAATRTVQYAAPSAARK
jgi:hypothetical protein